MVGSLLGPDAPKMPKTRWGLRFGKAASTCLRVLAPWALCMTIADGSTSGEFSAMIFAKVGVSPLTSLDRRKYFMPGAPLLLMSAVNLRGVAIRRQ